MSSWDAAGDGLTAYYDGAESFRFFDLDRLDTSSSIGNIGFGPQAPTPQLPGRGRVDFAVCDFAGANYAVVIRDGWIYLVLSDGSIVGKKSLLSFGPAIDAVRVEVTEAVAASPGEEIVISTQAGHVVWIGFFQLWEGTSPGPDLPITQTSLIPFPQTNESVAGGWAMDPVPLNGQIHFADQIGVHWAMDHDGTPHYRSNIVSAANINYSSPIMDMGHAGTTAGLDSQAWTTVPGPNFPTQPKIFTRNSFTVVITPGQEPGQEDPSWSSVVSATRTRQTPPNLRNAQEWLDTPLDLVLDENFWVFKKGGDVTRIGSPRITMQWGVPWPNHLSRVDYNIDSFGLGTVVYDEPSGDTGIWGSGGEGGSVSDYLSGAGDLSTVSPPDDFKDLRSDASAAHSMQSIRLGNFKGDGKTYAAISTQGGRLVILDATTNTMDFEFDSRKSPGRDYGNGGMALAVGNLDSDPEDEIIFGNFFRHTDSNGTRNFDASLIVFDYDGASFVKKQEIHLGELGLDPTLMPGFGIAGIAIANIDPSSDPEVPERHPGNEVIVTTLNGELYVFETGGSPLVTTPIHASVHAGSLGGCNSISVADLNGDGLMEIYVASSRGTYRFDIPPETGQ